MNKILKILFGIIFSIGTIGIIYVGWQTYDSQNKAIQADKDTSLNTFICNNGKGYKIGNYTGINSKKDINFLDDVEFRYVCSTGKDIATGDKQKIVDFIEGQDTHYFTTAGKLPNIYGNVFDNWPLANPSDIYIANPQLTNDQVEQAVLQLNHKDYDNITYRLVNVPKIDPPAKFDFKDTFFTFLLFLFVLYILQKFTFYILEKKKLQNYLIRLGKKYPLLIPSVIIGISLIIAADLVINNMHPEESFTLNQKCHDLATKYVNDMNTKDNNNPFNDAANPAPYTNTATLDSYAYNQQLNTCLAYYAVDEMVNPLASPAPSPVPSASEYTWYVDDVISGKNLVENTDCNNSENYCQSNANFDFQLKSWGLSDTSYWDILFYQTIGRFGFIRGWMGL